MICLLKFSVYLIGVLMSFDFARYVFGAGIMSWTWLKGMALRVAVQHAVLLTTKKKLLQQQKNVKGSNLCSVPFMLLCG